MAMVTMYALRRVAEHSQRACDVADLIGLVVVTLAVLALLLTTRARSRHGRLARSQRIRSRRRQVRLVTVVLDEDGVLVGYTDDRPDAARPDDCRDAPEIAGTLLLRLDPSTSRIMQMLDRWQDHDVTLVLSASPHDALVEIREGAGAPAMLVSQVRAP